MEGIKGGNTMETKAVTLHQPSKGLEFPMVLTAFDGEDHPVFDDAGYRGRYVMFSLIDGGVQDSFTDPYKSTHAMMTDELKDFCLWVRQGWRTSGREGINWTELEDGKEYVPDDFDSIDVEQ